MGSSGGYGAELDGIAIKRFLSHIFEANLRADAEGRRGTPICIWGTHGLGKTMSVTEFAHERGWRLAYCAPAQFEEMGDLHGLPTKIDPDPNVAGDEYTVFAPPAWVPKEDGPGILLLDDINRADDRILRGLMQLLQNFEMFSWTLPKKWQIVATANPESGDYSVTPMDDAMLTRMLHVRMKFDVKAWVAWAIKAGVDARGIDFVLTYPEVVTGGRTTPRSLTQFFDQIKDIGDLRSARELVYALAMSALDDTSVSAWMAFVDDNLERLITAEEILEAQDFAEIAKRIEILASGKEGAKRLDRLSAICTRLYVALAEPTYEPKGAHGENLVLFLLHDALPNDLRVSLHKDLIRNGKRDLVAMLRDKRLAELMLAGM